MNTEAKALKAELAAEFRKPKAKNVGKNGAKYYKGVPVDKVPVRDAGKIGDLHGRIAAIKNDNATPRKKTAVAKKDNARSARLKAKALAKRGKAVSYVPKWKK